MKIAVVGNSGAGKTVLSRKLSQKYQLPLTHVDSIQFMPGMRVRPLDETRKILQAIAYQNNWLMDGFGPLDLLEERFKLADKIIFIDFPLWRHIFWCLKRQIKNLWSPREELPEGCNEATLTHTIKLFRTVWKVHRKMRPELIKIFAREDLKDKMIYIRAMNEWNVLYRSGLGPKLGTLI